MQHDGWGRGGGSGLLGDPCKHTIVSGIKKHGKVLIGQWVNLIYVLKTHNNFWVENGF